MMIQLLLIAITIDDIVRTIIYAITHHYGGETINLTAYDCH